MVPFSPLQDIVVTLAAFAAAWVVVRRVLGFARAGRDKAACSTCSSAGSARPGSSAAPVVPLRLVRPGDGHF